MATRIAIAFSENGDKSVIPQTSAGEEVSFDGGYSSAYERSTDEAGYKFISRLEENYLRHTMSSNIKEWQEQTYPAYHADIAYPAFVCISVDGVPYISIQATTAGIEVTNTSYWMSLEDYLNRTATDTEQGQVTLSTNANATTGTGSGVVTAAQLRMFIEPIDDLMVGMEREFAGTAIPDRHYLEDGQVLNRADEPKLWAFAQASGVLISESAWQAELTSNETSVGKFSSGDGTTTFRLPLIIDYTRGTNTESEVGDFLWDAFQGHRHELLSRVQNRDIGTLSFGDDQDQARESTDLVGEPTSDGANGTPRTSSETRPKSVYRYRLIYAGLYKD